jgi:hypothetical protein
LQKNDNSIASVDELLGNANLRPVTENIGFQTSAEWKDGLDRITSGIEKDEFMTADITVRGAGFKLYYRDIMKVVQFLIGHKPFQNTMAYAPVQDYGVHGDKEVRVYSEMHTADRWWDLQTRLPPGATAIPLLFSSDKAVLSQTHGDKAVWPIYLSIGNIHKAVRALPSRPAFVLLGLLPTTKNMTHKSLKYELYQRSVACIAEGLEHLFYLVQLQY